MTVVAPPWLRRVQPYGLVRSFAGKRWLAGYGQNPTEVALGHGDPEGESVVIVGVIVPPARGTIDMHDTVGRRVLLRHADAHLATMRGNREALTEAVEELESSVPPARNWTTAQIHVNGEPRTFELFAVEDVCGAFARLDRSWVYVEGPVAAAIDIGLVPIADLTPYVESEGGQVV